MSIEGTLRDFARAYPEDVFTPLTASERKAYPTLITKASADMGRHFGKFALEAADRIANLEAENEALRHDLSKSMANHVADINGAQSETEVAK